MVEGKSCEATLFSQKTRCLHAWHLVFVLIERNEMKVRTDFEKTMDHLEKMGELKLMYEYLKLHARLMFVKKVRTPRFRNKVRLDLIEFQKMLDDKFLSI